VITEAYIYMGTTLPDEGVWDDRDWIEYPGQVLAGALSEILRDLGCKVDPIYSEGAKGWEFAFSIERVHMWTRIGAIEDFLIVLCLPGLLDLTGRKRRVFLDLLRRLNETLKVDPRFSHIRWYTKKQMDTGDWDYPGKDEAQAEPA
jgi:hypothetical protein